MKIETININEIKPAEYNPRIISPEEKEKLKKNMDNYGLVDPLIINLKNNTIIGGHQRYYILQEEDPTQTLSLIRNGDIGWIFNKTDLKIETPADEKALNLALNKISGGWDYKKLDPLLFELNKNMLDISITGFGGEDLGNIANLFNKDAGSTTEKETIPSPHSSFPLQDGYEGAGEKNSLEQKFIAPPFSILNANMGWWKEKKKRWVHKIQDKGQTREGSIDEGFGASITDPVLTQFLINNFAPPSSSNIFDPFSGDTTIGFVSGELGHTFTGIEIRKEQVELNTLRTKGLNVKYICDDGQNILQHVPLDSQDLLLSCPPYFNLEKYSNLPMDASNQKDYSAFMRIIETSFTNSTKALKRNRFAIIICGDIRDSTGMYFNFPMDIICIFKKQGFKLYNDIIYYEPLGSARLRANKFFSASRKVVHTHQNVLVFYKGDISKIKEEIIHEK